MALPAAEPVTIETTEADASPSITAAASAVGTTASHQSKGKKGKKRRRRLDFLKNALPGWRVYQAKKIKKRRGSGLSFWDGFFPSWWKEFPWRCALKDDPPSETDERAALAREPDNDEELEVKSKTVTDVEQKVIAWFNRQTSSEERGQNPWRAALKDLRAPQGAPPRRPIPWQYYQAHDDFKDKLQSLFEERDHSSRPASEHLRLRAALVQEMWEKEDEDVRSRIIGEAEEDYAEAMAQYEDDTGGAPSPDPNVQAEARRRLAVVVKPMLDLIQAYTGYELTLLAGRVDMSSGKAKVSSTSIHAAVTTDSPASQDFSRADPAQYNSVMAIFSKFVVNAFLARTDTDAELAATTTSPALAGTATSPALAGTATSPALAAASAGDLTDDIPGPDLNPASAPAPNPAPAPDPAENASTVPENANDENNADDEDDDPLGHMRYAPGPHLRAELLAMPEADRERRIGRMSIFSPAEMSREENIARNKVLMLQLGLGRASTWAGTGVAGQKRKAKGAGVKGNGKRVRAEEEQWGSEEGDEDDEDDDVDEEGAARAPRPVRSQPPRKRASGPQVAAQVAGNDKWALAAREQLKESDLGTPWLDLVSLWFSREESLHFVSPRESHKAKHRPPCIGEWVARARSPRYQPSIPDATKFGMQWRTWWSDINPAWRQPVDGGGGLLRSTSEKDWAGLDIPGANGFLNVLMCLKWWGNATAGGPRVEWDDAGEDARSSPVPPTAVNGAQESTEESTDPAGGSKGPKEAAIAGNAPSTRVSVALKPKPTSFEKLCGGLTGALHPRIDCLIDHCPATGGGSRPINYYVASLFKKRKITSITDQRLSKEDRALAYHQKALDNDWRIETSPHRASVVSTHCLVKFTVKTPSEVNDDKVVCSECWAVYLHREFRTAMNRNRNKLYDQLKCTPKIYDNPIQTKLMAKYKGLEGFLAKHSELSIYLRFAKAVGDGQYKDNQVFLGMLQTMQMATERRIRGVGMQNFKYPREFREWGLLIRMSSPHAYRNIAQEFRMESEHSISRDSHLVLPLNLSASYSSIARIMAIPLDTRCLSVDDTKLFPAMQPLYDGPAKSWFLIGLPGESQLQAATADQLEKLMDAHYSPATKLHLWAVQIPFPGIPPLAFAVLPIASKITASELTSYQLRAMSGLTERNFRFISNIADGAAVELSCQEQVAKAGTSILHHIAPPSDYSRAEKISIPLYDFRGNIYINTQDAPHARKTARNNIFSGVRGLVLSDFVVHYKQLYNMAMSVSDPTLYERDVIRSDRQDDNAAHRVFSAVTLKGLTDDPEENMGLIVFLFVIGELIDAYESCTMTHAKRMKVALRARIFLSTWKIFLHKMGYSIRCHYLPPGSTKIFHTLVDGLLGLILIHRDHLPSPTIPLLPWKHESMTNERIFSALCGIFPEMSLVQAMLAVPNIWATMSKAKHTLFSKASYKKVANGYSFCDTTEDSAINFVNLANFPTDLELSNIYGEAIEENDILWSLNVHVRTLVDASAAEPFMAPVDTSDNAELHLPVAEEDLELTATGAIIADLGIGLLKNEEQEIDACAYAAATLVVDGLSKIDDLPTHEDPALLEQSRLDVAGIIKLTPQAVESLLSGLITSFGGTISSSYSIHTPSSHSSLLDITSSDLLPLVQLREIHQTEHSRTGVRNYKPNKPELSHPNEDSRDAGAEKGKKYAEPSERQLLAQHIQDVIRQAEARKVITGLNRKARTEESENAGSVANKPGGNAANAAASAQVRAAAALRWRRNVSKTLKCHTLVSEAGIGPLACLEINSFILLIDRGEVVLARVLSLYAKGGGKAGAHAFISEADNIGPISFVFAQSYEHVGGHTFRRVHSGTAAMLGISRFAHIPAGSILLRVPDGVNMKQNFVELSSATTVKFKDLLGEKDRLVWMTTVLNTVQRRGADNVNIMDLDGDNDVDD
ncbi:hypothetical protein GGX14DRAFT_564031 [Mycena pura]|uniref:Uncharacterized protein n=1 Tax=Mycena pura TaxID=153505 RepID=A0AAD6VIE3_9AGAR|nr:hypothetical protein GGX14DRAFT_564031 [Mycena pura]